MFASAQSHGARKRRMPGQLAVLGKKNLDQAEGAPQTAETLKEIPDALTPSKETR